MNHRGSLHRFNIHPADSRNTAGNGPLRIRDRRPKLSREQARLRLGAALQRAKDSSLVQGTKITQRSQLAYWYQFCGLFDIDPPDFGNTTSGQIYPSLDQIRTEEEVLASFMEFLVACPRTGKAQNTANYAIQCISAIRSHYALMHGRRPAMRDGNRTGGSSRQSSGASRKHIQPPSRFESQSFNNTSGPLGTVWT